MLKVLTFLGKDSGFGKHNTSAYAIQNNRFLLIDCGLTVFPQLQELKPLLEQVDGIDVIITHLHDDHAGSLSQFIWWSHIMLHKNVNILSACRDIEKCLAMRGAPQKLGPAPEEELYTRNPASFDLEFIPTEHVKGMDAYGFAATINGSYVVYTGDTCTLEPYAHYIAMRVVHHNLHLYVDASLYGGVHLKIADNLDFLKELASFDYHVELIHIDGKEEIAKLIEGTQIKM